MNDASIQYMENMEPAAEPGPIAQSVAVGFRAIYVVTLLLGFVWLFSNVREIAPDSQAVVLRFGQIVDVQKSGLLLAWPRPIEEVRILPGPDRQLSQVVQGLPPVGGIDRNTAFTNSGVGIPSNAVPYLTGDGNVVLLDATLVYHISDPRAYLLSEEHIAPALNRLYHATAVQVAAGWGLNDFLVAQPSAVGGTGNQSIVALRTEVRGRMLSGINAKLQQLTDDGTGLGIQIERIDMTASLPPDAKVAFDAVLTATQAADQEVATARTEAEHRRQGAEREGDRLVSAAQAAASEEITNASVNTADIKALQSQETPQTRSSLITRAYRDRVADITSRVGSITLIDPRSGARYVLPGTKP